MPAPCFRGIFGHLFVFREVLIVITERELSIKRTNLLSPAFKTPEEIANGSPLLLDMVEDGRILFDRDNFFQRAMKDLKERLQRLGARRIWRGNAWYWDLKPDYKQGEIFEI